jgi:hypothetical protein
MFRYTDASLAQGFRSAENIKPELIDILEHMADLTYVVDVHHHQVAHTRDKLLTKLVVEGRNEVQHRLLSLYPRSLHNSDLSTDVKVEELDNKSKTRTGVSELVRLAACVYSDMVLFPLAWVSGVKPRLARRMYAACSLSGSDGTLAAASADACAFGHMELELWILWFGFFAAYQSELQDWFEDRLSEVAASLFVRRKQEYRALREVEFGQVRNTLSRFLWWDIVCDEPGKTLWERVQARET